jgi:Sulfotransferase family
MVAWRPNPFIFVHIPKCAGTSIEKAFIPIIIGQKDFGNLSEAQRSKYWLPGKKGLQHSKLKKYANIFDLSKFFKFAIVRNPWDRAVSQIQYLRSKTGESVFSGRSFKENLRIYCSSRITVWGHDLGACQVDYGCLWIDY